MQEILKMSGGCIAQSSHDQFSPRHATTLVRLRNDVDPLRILDKLPWEVPGEMSGGSIAKAQSLYLKQVAAFP